jgi:hypothetical protein
VRPASPGGKQPQPTGALCLVPSGAKNTVGSGVGARVMEADAAFCTLAPLR